MRKHKIPKRSLAFPSWGGLPVSLFSVLGSKMIVKELNFHVSLKLLTVMFGEGELQPLTDVYKVMSTMRMTLRKQPLLSTFSGTFVMISDVLSWTGTVGFA